jgi:Tfp pilus assembly ATPase PilU
MQPDQSIFGLYEQGRLSLRRALHRGVTSTSSLRVQNLDDVRRDRDQMADTTGSVQAARPVALGARDRVG